MNSWKTVFNSLSDSSFLKASRHYIGPINTPYNKQELIDRLSSFFSNAEVIENSRKYIDHDDAYFLSVIHLMSAPSTEINISKIIKNKSRLYIREKLLNLQERFIIWKNPDTFGLELTPLGEKFVKNKLISPAVITGTGTEITENNKAGSDNWLNDNFLSAALSFLMQDLPLFRKENSLRKKTLKIISSIYPSLFYDGRGEERLIAAGRALVSEKLIRIEDSKAVPVLENWKMLAGYSREYRINLIRARGCCGRKIPVETSMKIIRLFTECLPGDKWFSKDKLTALIQLQDSRAVISAGLAQRILSHLELMGIINLSEKGLYSVNAGHSSERGILNITPAGDISFPPEMQFSFVIAVSVKLEKVDTFTLFKISRKEFLKAADLDISAKILIEEIEKLSEKTFPHNIRVQLEEWEKDYKSVKIQKGIILEASGIKKQILEQTDLLKPYTMYHPSEGLWILKPEKEQEWRELLLNTGFDSLPPAAGIIKQDESVDSTDNNLITKKTPEYLPDNFLQDSVMCVNPDEYPVFSDCSDLLEKFDNAAQSAGFSEQEYTIFKERLERKLFLSEKQIKKNLWRYETMTAKGLDYRGKLRLTEAAIENINDRLEITVASGNSGIEVFQIIPKYIEKDGDDYVLTGFRLPEEEKISVKIRKIGFMKRISMSIL